MLEEIGYSYHYQLCNNWSVEKTICLLELNVKPYQLLPNKRI